MCSIPLLLRKNRVQKWAGGDCSWAWAT